MAEAWKGLQTWLRQWVIPNKGPFVLRTRVPCAVLPRTHPLQAACVLGFIFGAASERGHPERYPTYSPTCKLRDAVFLIYRPHGTPQYRDAGTYTLVPLPYETF